MSANTSGQRTFQLLAAFCYAREGFKVTADFRRALAHLEGCDPDCPGMFRNGETGRWDRCDDCAKIAANVLGHSYVRAVDGVWRECERTDQGSMLALVISDELVREFVKHLTHRTTRVVRVGSAPYRARRELQRVNGWGTPGRLAARRGEG